MSQSPSEGGFGAVVKPHRRVIPSDSGSDREVKNQDDSFNGGSAQSEQRAKDGVTDGAGSAPACFDTGTLLRFISEKDRAVQGPTRDLLPKEGCDRDLLPKEGCDSPESCARQRAHSSIFFVCESLCFPYIQAVRALFTCVTMTVIVFPGSHSTVRSLESLREMKHALFSQGSQISLSPMLPWPWQVTSSYFIFTHNLRKHPCTRFHVV
jgi:hypothetical protein